jgi:hypothetical protein
MEKLHTYSEVFELKLLIINIIADCLYYYNKVCESKPKNSFIKR